MMTPCLQVLLIFCLLGLTTGSGVADFLGKSIYVPGHDLCGPIAENIFISSAVLRIMPSSCIHETPVYISGRYFTSYKDTETFYSSITTSTGLRASLQSDFSLGITLQIQSKSIAGSTNTVTGNDLVIVTKSKSFVLEGTCLTNPSAFTDSFLKDLSNLPTTIDEPWLKSSWRYYDIFLNKYGTHLLTQITTGAKINQRSFARTSSSYSERDFQVKSCIELAGPTEVGMLGVSLCSNVTSEEIESVKNLKMSSTRTVNGGTATTRIKISQGIITPKLIEQFLNEANETDAPIRYQLIPVWDLIKQNFVGVSDNLIRGINMESYYLGYLNYGCQFIEQGTQNLQMFAITKSSRPDNPDYECTLAPEGCHSDNDCHYRPIWCSCNGDSCVHYKTDTLDTGKAKTTAYINQEPWGWHGCDWKTPGSYCACYNSKTERVRVWPDRTRQYDALYQAHNSMMEMRNQTKSEIQDREQFRNQDDL